ncbi:cell division protein FtsK [Pontibacillus yanchengensis]|uniref:Cell division protein FtsK n=1 Tax=Pontibacillus yanchengensis TaxID=462910 RepID=A0ACC7VEX2_9BACI|nr:FtsK/SpoIIIE domain-containing protein [Pontibacillus yanchengensis]MYL53322.1 cell division protein FtsK [Pontibacillus yanchengensis]
MFVEILSSAAMGSLLGYTYIYQAGLGGNDKKKIENIAKNCGLVAKDGKTIRIHRRSKKDGYTEYVFQIPQGLSAKEFRNKLDHFQDGLNIKKSVLDLALSDFKEVNWRGDLLSEIRAVIEKRQKLRKTVEVEFDGMLKFRVYNEGLPELFEYTEELFDKVKTWEIPIGVALGGRLIKHDFDKLAHMIIGGTTDFGKSNALKVIITTLIHKQPKHVSFSLIDLKGGLSFSRYKNVKQVDRVAKNSKEALEALEAVQLRLNKTMEYLEANGYEDVKEAGIKDRHFIVIDEAADIADNDKCQEILKDIARRGRAAGFRLLYATQYPTRETVSSQVKRNCITRLCFVLDTEIASRAVLDEGGAEELPLIQGRAIYKAHKKTVIQTPYIENKFIEKTIQPHVNIRAKRESGKRHEQGHTKGTTRRKHTLIVEETALS